MNLVRSLYSIANAVWSLIPVGNRTVTVTTNNDKTGYAATVEAGGITAASIASNAITSAKVAADAIGSSQIANDAITATKIATDAITAAKIATDAIGASEFAQGAADKVWGTTTRALTDKSNFHISSNGDKTGYSLAADQAVNASKWSGATVATPNVPGYPLVDTHYHRGNVENGLQSGRRDVYLGAATPGLLGLHSVQYVSATYDVNAGDGDGFIDVTLGVTIQGQAYPIPMHPYTNASNIGIPGGLGISDFALGPAWEILNATTIRCRFSSGAVAGSGSGSLQITFRAVVIDAMTP